MLLFGRTPRELLGAHLGLAVIVLVAGPFLAAVGAFDTDRAPALLRYPYWVLVMLTGGLIGALTTELFDARDWLQDRPLVRLAALTVVMSVPQTVAVYSASRLMFGGGWDVWDLLGLYPAVLLVSAAVLTLDQVTRPRDARTHAAAPQAARPRFLDRLPPRLQGAELHAVEAEDHYLRLHTSAGSDLLLMRLSDAMAELEGIEGAQTHRSWWVAKGAVTGARPVGRRYLLTLPNGVEAPVSRANVGALRSAGWF
jgi:LytTr DNA-binding domain